MTGGGDFFEDNYHVLLDMLSKKIPILAVFSDAGAFVYNRYGFFWNLSRLDSEMDNFRVLFESDFVLNHNIEQLLRKKEIPYSTLPRDPSFAKGIWLANQNLKCIIASPLTSNSVAKLTTGINDTLVLNLLSAGKKAGQMIGIFPTDRGFDSITSKLPVRKTKPVDSKDLDPKVCSYGALDLESYSNAEYLSEFCVGCRKCVEKYPEIFSVDEEIEIHIRSIDQVNTQKLRDEFRVFHSPEEISSFISAL
ncbi:MAG: flavoprotein [Candidatus Hodarchaeales archaeon]